MIWQLGNFTDSYNRQHSVLPVKGIVDPTITNDVSKYSKLLVKPCSQPKELMSTRRYHMKFRFVLGLLTLISQCWLSLICCWPTEVYFNKHHWWIAEFDVQNWTSNWIHTMLARRTPYNILTSYEAHKCNRFLWKTECAIVAVANLYGKTELRNTVSVVTGNETEKKKEILQ